MQKPLAEYDILGVSVSALTMSALTDMIFAGTAGTTPRVFAHVNLHGLFLLERSGAMRDLLRSAYVVHIDGMPVTWIGRALGYPLRATNRITYVDWLPEILRNADRRKARLFYFGGEPGVGERAAVLIAERYPGISFAHQHGYVANQSDHARVVDRITAFRPHVLFVGMGMPRQEEWILANRSALPACAVLPCGACFDYFTGMVPTPPRFLGPLGLEWLFRLATDPKRLWRRYVMEPIALTPRVSAAILARRGRPGA